MREVIPWMVPSPADKIWLHAVPDGRSMSVKMVFRLTSKHCMICANSQNANVYLDQLLPVENLICLP